MIISQIYGTPTEKSGEYLFTCDRCRMRHVGMHTVETHYCDVKTPPPEPQESAPGLLDKVKNFTTAAAKHIAAGMPRASEEEVALRFAICQGCEFLKDNACMKCGCHISGDKKLISKLSWADQKCPIGKW